MVFNDWLARRRLLTPDRVAVVDDATGQAATYGQLDRRACAVASHLQCGLGLTAGDRVACLAGNCVEYLTLYFACGKIGVVLVPLNYRLPAAGLRELLADCGPALLVYEEEFSDSAVAAADAGRGAKLLPIEQLPSSDGAIFAAGASPPTYHVADEDDVAMVLYTSGATGRAKGAMITWRQIHYNALNTIIGLGLTQDDAAFLNMPLYHTGGWHVLFTPLMLLGGRVVLQRRFDPVRCNERTGPERITIVFAIPTMMRMMWEADNFTQTDFSQVRFAICGGEPCPLPVIEAYQARGVAVRQGYGLTEAGPNCFSLPAEDAVRKQGSIGFPNFLIAARLMRDDGTEAGVDEVGELWMKGPHVFAGYWGDEGQTSSTLCDGWVRTGDLLTRDAEGYHYVVGRLKEMYVSGGENVYPVQIERVLQRHAAVAQAAVVGAPDPKWGESGWAFLKLHADETVDESTLRTWCREHLAGYQCPSHIITLDELPLGASGKVDKLALRQIAAQGEGTS